MNQDFKTVADLYKKVMPALKIKRRELYKKGIKKEEKDIFNDLIKKWSKKVNLSLNEIVNDILNY